MNADNIQVYKLIKLQSDEAFFQRNAHGVYEKGAYPFWGFSSAKTIKVSRFINIEYTICIVS
jgi:hypothetical protein